MHRMVECKTETQFFYEMEEHKNWEKVLLSLLFCDC